jgi:hypothetical protein
VEVIAAAQKQLLERAACISDPELRDSFLHRVPDHARTLELSARWGAAQPQ